MSTTYGRRSDWNCTLPPVSLDGGFLDSVDDFCDLAAPSHVAQVRPAGKWLEVELQAFFKILELDLLAALQRGMKGGSVDPDASQGAPVDQRISRLNTRPVSWRHDEILFATLTENVFETLVLGGLFVANRYRMVPMAPTGSRPIVQVTDLDRQAGLQLTHETRHLADRFKGCQQVEVCRQESSPVHHSAGVLLSSGEAPDCQGVEAAGGSEKVPTLKGPLGNFDQGPFFVEKAYISSHTYIEDKGAFFGQRRRKNWARHQNRTVRRRWRS